MSTLDDALGLRATPCRSVTTDEVDHYHELGWVKLAGFVDPDIVRGMLDLAREMMGDDADSNPLSPFLEAAVAEGKAGLEYFNAQRSSGLTNPLLRPLIHAVGRSAQQLQRRRTPDGSPMGARYYQDLLVPKLPSSRETRHGGNGPTAFHQDFITFAVDRSGGMTFWFPLEAYGPDAGTMSFVNGSHRAGVLGDYTTYGGRDLLEVFPELRALDISEPVTYELGDITVHTHLTIHGAGPNLLNRPRWAYILITQPADACWNGSPCPNFDYTTM